MDSFFSNGGQKAASLNGHQFSSAPPGSPTGMMSAHTVTWASVVTTYSIFLYSEISRNPRQIESRWRRLWLKDAGITTVFLLSSWKASE